MNCLWCSEMMIKWVHIPTYTVFVTAESIIFEDSGKLNIFEKRFVNYCKNNCVKEDSNKTHTVFWGSIEGKALLSLLIGSWAFINDNATLNPNANLIIID